MKVSTPTPIRFLKLVALLLLCAILAAPSAQAQSGGGAIKMLPPTNCPNVPTGQPNVWGVLGWDSKSPLSCIPNFNFGDNSYVGVGSATTQPLALLDLYGSGTYPYPTPGTGTVGTNLGNIHMQPVDNTDFNSTAITFGGNMTASPSNGNYDGVAEAGIYLQYSRSTAYPAPGGGVGTRMLFGTTNNYATGAQIRMTIDNNGNVGIGTTVPAAPLDVSGGMRGNNSSVVANGGCSPEGMLGYDMTNHEPVYCSTSGLWTPILPNRTWHTVGNTGTNTNSYPIEISAICIDSVGGGGPWIALNVNGTMISSCRETGYINDCTVYGEVPSGASFSVGGGGGCTAGQWTYALY